MVDSSEIKLIYGSKELQRGLSVDLGRYLYLQVAGN